jgi:hypothetical protein
LSRYFDLLRNAAYKKFGSVPWENGGTGDPRV